MANKASADAAKLRPRPIQTAAPAPLPSARSSEEAYRTPQTPRQADVSSGDDTAQRGPVPKSQRFVLTDPIAFRYLEDDPSTTVLNRRQELTGYECYIVEQWITSRKHPTFAITTYTGDPTHTVTVGVLSVPVDETTWSPRLRVYFKALNQNHARRRETPLGIIMVTTLSGFPSSLTVVPVPDGDLSKHRFDFFVNEDLKRLGCSGRVGLALAQPTQATVSKFHQLYRTSDKVEIFQAVIELVKLCQSALLLFGKLGVDYADGLLCDVTERAINDWWSDMGSDQYEIEPHDGILGPTTVAGLLGLLMGARNRLNSVNTPVSKDAFDVETMKHAIGAFQKQQRMPRTRRLDRRTLDHLHKATQKAAEKERWGVQKAVKSTVAELSGKGNDVNIDGAGRRDRAGIAEIETVDMDRFSTLVYGDRCKWLWFGKPMKKHKDTEKDDRAPEDMPKPSDATQGLILKPDDQGGFTWAPGRKDTALEDDSRSKLERDHEVDRDQSQLYSDEQDDRDESKMSVRKRASAFKDEAKHGLGKVREAVGLRSHKSKMSVDDPTRTSPVQPGDRPARQRPNLLRAHTSPMSSPGASSAAVPREQNNLDAAVAEHPVLSNGALTIDEHDIAKAKSTTDLFNMPAQSTAGSTSTDLDDISKLRAQLLGKAADGDRPSLPATAEPSIAGSVYGGVDLNDALPTGPETGAELSCLLKRTVSFDEYVSAEAQVRPDDAFPRHLSFSLAEDSVLRWTSITPDGDTDASSVDVVTQIMAEAIRAEDTKRLRHLVQLLQSETATWTETQLQTLNGFLDTADQHLQNMEEAQYLQSQHVQTLQGHSESMLVREKETWTENVKELEAQVARLEYEISGLRGKVEDVEAGVGDYEKGVVQIEDRVSELQKDSEKRSAWSCIVS